MLCVTWLNIWKLMWGFSRVHRQKWDDKSIQRWHPLRASCLRPSRSCCSPLTLSVIGLLTRPARADGHLFKWITHLASPALGWHTERRHLDTLEGVWGCLGFMEDLCLLSQYVNVRKTVTPSPPGDPRQLVLLISVFGVFAEFKVSSAGCLSSIVQSDVCVAFDMRRQVSHSSAEGAQLKSEFSVWAYEHDLLHKFVQSWSSLQRNTSHTQLLV